MGGMRGAMWAEAAATEDHEKSRLNTSGRRQEASFASRNGLERSRMSLIRGLPPSRPAVGSRGKMEDQRAYVPSRVFVARRDERVTCPSAEQGRQVMRQMRSAGTQHPDPAEEVVFSLYEGPSTAAVLQFNERAAIPVSRIVDAFPVKGLHR
jgi:hypothetical protein